VPEELDVVEVVEPDPVNVDKDDVDDVEEDVVEDDVDVVLLENK
jgi:hypothetical protein